MGGETVQITMPQMGESVSEGTVLTWLKQEGDAVEKDETVVEVSTDKVDAEVPAPASGKLTRSLAGEDEVVAVGALLGEIEVGAGADGAGPDGGGPAPERSAPPAAPEAPAAAAQPQAAAATRAGRRAGPRRRQDLSGREAGRRRTRHRPQRGRWLRYRRAHRQGRRAGVHRERRQRAATAADAAAGRRGRRGGSSRRRRRCSRFAAATRCSRAT